MPESGDIFMMMLGLIGALGGTIALMIYKRLGELRQDVKEISATLHSRVTGVVERIARVEARCAANHGPGAP
jgi:hypothetical protein